MWHFSNMATLLQNLANFGLYLPLAPYTINNIKLAQPRLQIVLNISEYRILLYSKYKRMTELSLSFIFILLLYFDFAENTSRLSNEFYVLFHFHTNGVCLWGVQCG